MTLQEIETLVLNLIGYDAYSELSISADSAKKADFAAIHQCVRIARNEINRGCFIPALFKHLSPSILTVVGQVNYLIGASDFDIPVVVRLTTASAQIPLTRITPQNILEKVAHTTDRGTPGGYQIFGDDGLGGQYIELYNIPDTAGQILDIDYKKILPSLIVATDEDLIMRKYPETVMKIATAWAFQLIKKDMSNYATWLKLGLGDFPMINLREIGFDPDPRLGTDPLLASRRKDRPTI